MLALATVPLLGLFVEFETAQKVYALVGAAFIPLLAAAVLTLNRSRAAMGSHAYGWKSTLALSVALILSLAAGVSTLQQLFAGQ